MLARLSQQLPRRIPAVLATARRHYAAPLTLTDAGASEQISIAARVRRIIHPSTHDRIQHTKDLAQDARMQGQDVGARLAADSRKHHETQRAQLRQLHSEATAGTAAATLSPGDFGALLAGFSELNDGSACVRVLRQMREAGAPVLAAQYTTALRAAGGARQPAAIYGIGEEMRRAGVAADDARFHVFFEQLVGALARGGQAEHAYAVLREMQHRGTAPSRAATDALVQALADIDEPALALQSVRDAQQRGGSLGALALLALLHAAGRGLHLEAFSACWRALQTLGAQVPEGDCEAGLRVAARAGDAALAEDILRAMQARGLSLAEFHLEPLLDALVAAARWAPALRVLHAMRSSGVGRTPATLRCLARALAAQPVAAVDAVFALVREAREADAPLAADAVTVDALVLALALGGHAAEAAARLGAWYADLGIERSAASYAAVLRGCVHPSNKTVAEAVMAQMLDAGVQPTARVLETMVLVSLGQFSYEDAFVYLESMKAHSMVPAWRTYAAVVRRCARVRDPRAQTALREMQALGYPVTDALRSFVALHGRSARYTPAAPRKADREAAEPAAPTQQPGGHARGAPSFKI